MLSLAAAMLFPFPLRQTAASAFAFISRAVVNTSPTNDDASVDDSRRRYAQRIKLTLKGSREIVLGEPVVNVTVIDPQTVAAEVRGERSIILTGLSAGETVVIVSCKSGRSTYAVGSTAVPRV